MQCIVYIDQNRKPGFPYYVKNATDIKVTFFGRAAELMIQYKESPSETDDIGAILADYLEENPDECTKPDLIPCIVECLRLIWITKKSAYQLGY